MQVKATVALLTNILTLALRWGEQNCSTGFPCYEKFIVVHECPNCCTDMLKVSTVTNPVQIESSHYTRMYPKVSGLATWSENFKWYSSLPPDGVVSLFCESV
jgi:hypothetical protein